MKNKILAYLLTLTMAVTFIPLGFGVSAAEKGAAATRSPTRSRAHPSGRPRSQQRIR